MQEATGHDWPVVVLIAGLPAMREPDHSVTYFERGTWHELGVLEPDDAIAALREPAERAGRPMDQDAAAFLASASGGYPYALQLLGHHAWRQSAEQARIEIAAAERALPRAQRQLERGLYASRWRAAAPTHRRYLAAVAELITTGQSATSRAVADRLGKGTRDLSRVRDYLIKYGTLTAEQDTLRFTIPGMAQYVARQQAREPHDASLPTAPAAIFLPRGTIPRARETRANRGPTRKPKR